MTRRTRVLAVAGIVLAGAVTYSSAFPGAFVFDDAHSIVDNALLDRPLSYLPGGEGYRSQPSRALTFATFALDRAIAGRSPSFHRAVNVAIHVVAALLVMALVVTAFRSRRLAGSRLAGQAWAVGLAAGLLFVTHPIQTQAVSYIVQRLASLSGLLYLATTVTYVRWRLAREDGREGIRPWLTYGGALVLALLATKTKESALTLPLALVVVEAVLFQGRLLPRALGLIPFLATLAVIPLTTVLAQAPAGVTLADVSDATRLQTTMSRSQYFLTELTVVVRYLGLVVLPRGQSLDHDVRLRDTLLDPAVLGAAILLSTLLALAGLLLWMTSSRRTRSPDPAWRLVALGILWFFLGLSVESSLIPIVDPMYEHRVYLPFAGIAMAVATMLGIASARFLPRRAGVATTVAALGLSAVLGVVAWNRNAIWTSPEAVWRDAVERAPGKARPRHNVGIALLAAGRVREAIPWLQQAVALDPLWRQAHESLGFALSRVGRVAEAQVHFQRGVDLAPTFADQWESLGREFLAARRYEEAEASFREALKLQKAYPDALAGLARTWNASGRPGEAVSLLRGSRDAIRSHAPARAELAIALAATGDRAGAQAEVEAIRTFAPLAAQQLEQRLRQASAGER